LQFPHFFIFAEDEIVFEGMTSEAEVASIGTVDFNVAIVADEMVKQKPKAFSPEVREKITLLLLLAPFKVKTPFLFFLSYVYVKKGQSLFGQVKAWFILNSAWQEEISFTKKFNFVFSYMILIKNPLKLFKH
jgi:hypothetical protein